MLLCQFDGYICPGVDWETDSESEEELDIKLEAVLETETDIEAHMMVYGVDAEYPVDDLNIGSPSYARSTSETEADHEDTLETMEPTIEVEVAELPELPQLLEVAELPEVAEIPELPEEAELLEVAEEADLPDRGMSFLDKFCDNMLQDVADDCEACVQLKC